MYSSSCSFKSRISFLASSRFFWSFLFLSLKALFSLISCFSFSGSIPPFPLPTISSSSWISFSRSSIFLFSILTSFSSCVTLACKSLFSLRRSLFFSSKSSFSSFSDDSWLSSLWIFLSCSATFSANSLIFLSLSFWKSRDGLLFVIPTSLALFSSLSRSAFSLLSFCNLCSRSLFSSLSSSFSVWSLSFWSWRLSISSRRWSLFWFAIWISWWRWSRSASIFSISASSSLSLCLAFDKSSWSLLLVFWKSSSSLFNIPTCSFAASISIFSESLSLFTPSTSSSKLIGRALSTSDTVCTGMMSICLLRLSFRSVFSFWAFNNSLRIFS